MSAAKHSQASQYIILLTRGWCTYAKRHQERFESSIGEDYVLGDHWADIGYALLGLLNGDCGALDCGTLDSIIRDNLQEAGFNPDTQKRERTARFTHLPLRGGTSHASKIP